MGLNVVDRGPLSPAEPVLLRTGLAVAQREITRVEGWCEPCALQKGFHICPIINAPPRVGSFAIPPVVLLALSAAVVRCAPPRCLGSKRSWFFIKVQAIINILAASFTRWSSVLNCCHLPDPSSYSAPSRNVCSPCDARRRSKRQPSVVVTLTHLHA